METKIKTFLEFNGQNILFLSKDGVYWVAVKPICDALGVGHAAQLKSIKRDHILGSAWSVQTIQIPHDQPRNMVCIPEKYIYGWLFQIRSDSPDFLMYKWKCYEILYDYFQGSLSKRHILLKEKSIVEIEIEKIEQRLSDNRDYKRLSELKKDQRKHERDLKKNDQEIIQLELFTSEN